MSTQITFTSGNIDATSNDFNLGEDATNFGSVSHVSGYVIGSFNRWINTSTTSYTFHVGNTALYRPAILNFTAISNGKMGVQFNDEYAETNGLPLKPTL